MITAFQKSAFQNNSFQIVVGPPPPPVDQGVSIPVPRSGVAGGGMAIGTRIEPQFVPKPKPYEFRRNTENQDRRDIESIIALLYKGEFL